MNDTKTAPASASRRARVERVTRETTIVVAVNLDGTGRAELATGVPFLDHMLDQVARHGMLDLSVQAKGDLHIDAHRDRAGPARYRSALDQGNAVARVSARRDVRGSVTTGINPGHRCAQPGLRSNS